VREVLLRERVFGEDRIEPVAIDNLPG